MKANSDYYEVLQVSPSARPDEIQRSFRALVRRHHPDRNPGDHGAAERTKRLIDAYKVLSDPAERHAYDQSRLERIRARQRAEDLRSQRAQEESRQRQRENERQRPLRRRREAAMPPSSPRRGSSNAGVSCISLAALAQRMRAWDRLPQMIQGLLRQSVLITLAVNLICIPLFWMLSSMAWPNSPVTSKGFFLGITADIVNFLLNLTHHVAPWLLALNIASLVLTLIVVMLSWGFTRRVDEIIHWLAWSAAFPSGASVASTVLLIVLLIAIVVITLIIWIIIIGLVIAIIVGVLAAIGGR